MKLLVMYFSPAPYSILLNMIFVFTKNIITIFIRIENS
jgi:hypothetical protein